MADLLVRGLNDKAVERLKAHAAENQRSLQGEARHILESAGEAPLKADLKADRRRIIEKWRRHFGSRRFSDSAAPIREDRARFFEE